jgi:hypothetical protein
VRPFERLADNEFEDLVGDLLGAEEGRRYERFRRGPDSGIDLRCIEANRHLIVQCKHYRNSSFSQLRTAARHEAAKLGPVESSRHYRFVTSLPLTPANKSALVEDLNGWLADEGDILGAGDLEALLDRHPEVERRHVKLWLAGGTALEALLNADVLARSRALLAAIDRALPLYVQTEAFLLAHEKLELERICLIGGQPGIGKSTLARMLVADAVKQGFEPIEVSNDVEEAWALSNPQVAQVFYYDDFLGTTTLGELSKNEDQRLISFIEEVLARTNALFILTTREYILNQALDLYESFERAGLERNRFLLEIGHYSRLDRAKILYNHVYHSDLPAGARSSLARRLGYNRIVSHPLFNPRLIEAIAAGYGEDEMEEGLDFVDYAVSILEDPAFFWRRIYDRQLGEAERLLLIALASMPRPAELGDLRVAFSALAGHFGVPSDEFAFRAALRILDDSMVRTGAFGTVIVVDFVNPSVEDFLEARVQGDRALLTAAADSAPFFDQLLWFFARHVDPDAAVRLAFAERCLAKFDSPAIVWDRSKTDYGRPTIQRAELDLESRLTRVLNLLGPGDEGADFDEARRAAAKRLDELSAAWIRGDGCASGVWLLMASLELWEAPIDRPADLDRRLMSLLVAQAASPADYRSLLDFGEDNPQILSADERETIATQFLFEATEALRNSHELKASESVDDYIAVAEELGVEIDPELIEEARRTIASKKAARAERGLESIDNRSRESMVDVASEQAEIDNLFSRLLD